MTSILPVLAFFNIDWVLIPYTINSDVKLQKGSKVVVDRTNETIHHFPEVPAVFEKLTNQGIKIGLSYDFHDTYEVNEIISLFGWKKYITYQEDYYDEKPIHFEFFHNITEIPYNKIVFFANENNTHVMDALKMGIYSMYVDPETGITTKFVDELFGRYEDKQKKGTPIL